MPRINLYPNKLPASFRDKALAPWGFEVHTLVNTARSLAFIGDENATSAPAFLRNGAAPWSKLPSIKYITLSRTRLHKRNGYARKLAARRLEFGVTNCSAERGKLKPHSMCRSGLILPVFNHRNERPPSP
jgi:hypothetical protein